MAAQANHTGDTATSSRRTLWSAPIAVALTFLLVGCYTILKHPITSTEGPMSQVSHQEYYRDRCLDCHADYATYPYGFFYGDYPEYYFEYPRWGHYYAYPWWWDHYWYESDGDAAASEDGIDSAEPGTKASRQSGLRPPYVGGAPAMPTGIDTYRSSGSSGSTTKGTGTETGTASPGTSTQKTRVKAADESGSSSDGTTQSTETKEKKKTSRGSGIKP